jgi:YidC/Oxa1 family membrane protein insertase
MKFYSENKVNPFASCLPLLAQLPVFLALFYMLRKDLRHDICPSINPANIADPKPCGASGASEFWFIHDITDKATGGVLVTLLVLYVGSQLISSLLMMTATADKNQRIIMLVLPFVFVPFVYSFPAGLIMYWITTNVWTIGQQQFLRRVIGKGETPPALATAGANGSGDGKAGGGGLFERLSGAAAAQQTAKAAPAEETRVTKAPPAPPRKKNRKRSGRRR